MSTDSSLPDGVTARRAAAPDPASTGGGPARRAADTRSFSGSLGWTVLGTLVPGLGLWRAGRRLAGGVALAVFVLALAGAAYLATNRTLASSILVSPGVLHGTAIGLLVVAAAWVLVIGFTHLALRPSNPTIGQRAAGAAVVGLLSFTVAAPMAVGANLAWTAGDTVTNIFGGNETPTETQPTLDAVDPWANKNRLNILILGGDQSESRDDALGNRTDTVIVASIDTHTGATTLFTLPRNTEKMPFPRNSPLHKYYPYGFTKPGASLQERAEYLLNAMYRNVPNQVPHNVLGKTKDLGADVVKVSVGEALGLDIDYYVLVNMTGFKDFINAIGGITVNVNYRIPIGGQTDQGVPPEGYIEPEKDKHLDGRMALWYARGRYGLDDYKRMERQRCVINAVVQQSTPQAVLTNFQAIAKAGEKTIVTDVPASLLPAMLELGMKVKDTKLRSVVFNPGESGFRSYDPDWPAVRARVKRALKETAAGVEPTATPSATSSPSGSATPGSSASPTKKATSKPRSQDLEDACAWNPEKG